MPQALEGDRGGDYRAAASERFQDLDLDSAADHERADHHLGGVEPGGNVGHPARDRQAALTVGSVHKPPRRVGADNREGGIRATAQDIGKDIRDE